MGLENGLILIVANGIITDLARMRPYMATAEASIAADGGVAHMLALGYRPDVLIGDLDSLPEGLEAELPSWSETKIIRFPVAKDETDLELALLYATEHYPGREIVIMGGLGGRLDQTLANILLLAHPRLSDSRIRLVEGVESAWLVREGTEIRGRAGDRVSLIPLDNAVRIRETTGLRWPLRNDQLTFGPARGISNVMTAETATVRLDHGLLLCIHADRAE